VGDARLKFSVVVPAFNEEKLLGATLASIREAARLPGWEFELIVCDNNSTDRTAEIARAAGATVVFEPVNQIGRARNTGAAKATGDWLVFIDADSQPSRELFLELQSVLEQEHFVGGGSTVVMDTDDAFARLAVRMWNRLSRATGWAAGSFIFCRAGAFRELGGFNEQLYAAEEIDLSRRLKRRGRMTILHRHPLRTSGRKARLYSWRELLALLFKVIVTGGRALRRREDCYAWYDGRR
jgi:glycosyltransferase involved in cell wall biosynthesis